MIGWLYQCFLKFDCSGFISILYKSLKYFHFNQTTGNSDLNDPSNYGKGKLLLQKKLGLGIFWTNLRHFTKSKKSSVIWQKGESQNGCFKKTSAPNFPKNEHFLPTDKHKWQQRRNGSKKNKLFGNKQWNIPTDFWAWLPPSTLHSIKLIYCPPGGLPQQHIHQVLCITSTKARKSFYDIITLHAPCISEKCFKININVLFSHFVVVPQKIL